MELERIRSRASQRRAGVYLGDRFGRGKCFVQGDQDIANQAGGPFRADLNNELKALVSNNSGATAPTTTYAYMWWFDTTTGTRKQRNAANTGWVVRGTLNEAIVLSRASNIPLGVSDIGKTIVATGTFTQTLGAAATLGDGWYVLYRNDGSGYITIDPNAAETIDGATTIVLGPGGSCIISCNGTSFKTIGRSGGRMSIWMPAAGMVSQTTSGATPATRKTATNDVMLRTMNFPDNDAKTYAQFQIAMPYGWDLGAIRCVPHWTHTAGTGNVVWGFQAVACSDGDTLDAAWSTGVTVTDTAMSANYEHRAPMSGDITIAGTPAANDLVSMRVYRAGDSASDTFNGTAELIGVMVHYNVKTLDDAQ